MQERDLPFVMEIERLSFPNPWKESAFRGEMENSPISVPRVVLLRPQEKVIGYVIFWRIQDEAQISNIAVHPEYRRLGVAEAVLRETLFDITRYGPRIVVLEVRPSNLAARRLYEKFGFVILGIRRGYYQDPQEDALVMVKYLDSDQTANR